jgi:hypothetical protein
LFPSCWSFLSLSVVVPDAQAWLQSVIHFLRIASHPSAPPLSGAISSSNASPDVAVDLHFAVDHYQPILADQTVNSYLASITAAAKNCALLADDFQARIQTPSFPAPQHPSSLSDIQVAESPHPSLAPWQAKFEPFEFLLEEHLGDAFAQFLSETGMPAEREHNLPDVVAFVNQVGWPASEPSPSCAWSSVEALQFVHDTHSPPRTAGDRAECSAAAAGSHPRPERHWLPAH